MKERVVRALSVLRSTWVGFRIVGEVGARRTETCKASEVVEQVSPRGPRKILQNWNAYVAYANRGANERREKPGIKMRAA